MSHIEDKLNPEYQAAWKNQPSTPMHPTSRELLYEDPTDWIMSRKRALKATVLNEDYETTKTLLEDTAHLIGYENANKLILLTFEQLFISENAGN